MGAHLCCPSVLYPTRESVHDPSLWEKETTSSGIYASLLSPLSYASSSQPNCLQCQNQRDSGSHFKDATSQETLKFHCAFPQS